MGVSASSLKSDMTPETLEGYKAELLTKCEEILMENPGNRCCKHVIKYLASDEGKKMSSKGKIFCHEDYNLYHEIVTNHLLPPFPLVIQRCNHIL